MGKKGRWNFFHVQGVVVPKGLETYDLEALIIINNIH